MNNIVQAYVPLFLLDSLDLHRVSVYKINVYIACFLLLQDPWHMSSIPLFL